MLGQGGARAAPGRESRSPPRQPAGIAEFLNKTTSVTERYGREARQRYNETPGPTQGAKRSYCVSGRGGTSGLAESERTHSTCSGNIHDKQCQKSLLHGVKTTQNVQAVTSAARGAMAVEVLSSCGRR
jgi:hypothetical protein